MSVRGRGKSTPEVHCGIPSPTRDPERTGKKVVSFPFGLCMGGRGGGGGEREYTNDSVIQKSKEEVSPSLTHTGDARSAKSHCSVVSGRSSSSPCVGSASIEGGSGSHWERRG